MFFSGLMWLKWVCSDFSIGLFVMLIVVLGICEEVNGIRRCLELLFGSLLLMVVVVVVSLYVLCRVKSCVMLIVLFVGVVVLVFDVVDC